MTNFWAQKIFTIHGFVKEDILGGKKALDVGCGTRKLPGAIGMDMIEERGIEFVHNANVVPWPFGDNVFDLVLFNQSLEHLDDIEGALAEASRVLKTGSRAIIQVPYFRSVDAFAPTHRHFFTSTALDAIPSLNFKVLSFWFGWPHPSNNPLRQAFKNLIHRFPNFYDKYLSIFIPVECLTWELEVRK